MSNNRVMKKHLVFRNLDVEKLRNAIILKNLSHVKKENDRIVAVQRVIMEKLAMFMH